MKLSDALVEVEHDKNHWVWAKLIEGHFTGDSDAVYGEKSVENKCESEGYLYVCNGEYPGRQYMLWANDGDSNVLDYTHPDFIDHMIEDLNGNGKSQ